MPAIRTKSAFLYDRIRQELQTGRYHPGERVDPAALARTFNTSLTPVRFAVYRLIGEGILDDHAREGIHVPFFTERSLRSHYDWMQRLLLMACHIGSKASELPETFTRDGHSTASRRDVIAQTRALFESISLASGHLVLHQAVTRTNDKLEPIRRLKQGLIPAPVDELADLQQKWAKRDFIGLRTALVGYHRRRIRLVPRIVVLQDLPSSSRPSPGRAYRRR